MANKYSKLSALSFSHRSAEDQKAAMSYHNHAESMEESSLIADRIKLGDSPFNIDETMVTENYLYRRLGQLGQLAPSYNAQFQNRIAHSQAAAHVAERIAKRMNLDEHSCAMAESIVFAHDLGHPPFSHEGEAVLKEEMAKHGGYWDHDYFGQRMLMEFGHGSITRAGIPLTNGTLEGAVKRYKRYSDDKKPDHFNRPTKEVAYTMRQIDGEQGVLHLDKWSPIEGQVAAISDWISFITSDTRDVLLMKLHEDTPRQFMVDMQHYLRQFPMAEETWKRIQDKVEKIERDNPQTGLSKGPFYARMQATINVFYRELEDQLINDVLDTTLARYEQNVGKIRNAEDVRNLDTLLVSFSPNVMKEVERYQSYMSKQVFPKILNENVDVKALMQNFFGLVRERFEKPEINGITIGQSWRDLYTHIKESDKIPEDKKGLLLTDLVSSYITINFTDRDVIALTKEVDPESFKRFQKGNGGKYHPQQAHPDKPETFVARLQSQRGEGIDLGRL